MPHLPPSDRAILPRIDRLSHAIGAIPGDADPPDLLRRTTATGSAKAKRILAHRPITLGTILGDDGALTERKLRSAAEGPAAPDQGRP